MPDITCTEYIAQEYGHNNFKISAGMVEGHPIDTMYLRVEKDGMEPIMLLLRPDEVAAIAWCCTGILYSLHVEPIIEAESTADKT